MYDRRELLKTLCDARAPSGFEEEVRKIIQTEASRRSENLEVDLMGNLYAKIEGRRKDAPKIMVVAHMDEVGFIVNYIEKEGFLRFSLLGSLDLRVLLGQRISLLGFSKYLGGNGN